MEPPSEKPINVFCDPEPLLFYPSGISIYTLFVLREIQESDPSVRIVCGYATARRRLHRKLLETAARGKLRGSFSRITLPGRVAGCFPSLARAMARPPLGPIDLVHATAYVPPGWIRGHWTKLVLTIHDLAFLRDPGIGYVPRSAASDPATVCAAAAKADAVITASEFTKREVCDLLAVPEERVFVTPLASQFDGEAPDQAAAKSVLAQYGLRHGRYFLSVGMLSPRKNYETLLEAFETFRKEADDATLVVVGGVGWRAETIVKRLRELAPAVCWIQGAGAAQLQALYSAARGLFLVSWYEGFGLPVLEAMACGCAVCYSTGSAMDELAGEAGLAAAPDDTETIVEAFKKLWCDDDLAEDLRRKGRKRASQFSWKRTARETVAVYRRVLE